MIVQVKLGYDQKSERGSSQEWCLEITELVSQDFADESNSSIYRWTSDIISAPRNIHSSPLDTHAHRPYFPSPDLARTTEFEGAAGIEA